MPEYKIDNVDFFADANKTEPPRTDMEAYLIDGKPAFTTAIKGVYPEVTIKNPSALDYQFVPVDHNIIIRRVNGDLEKSCDGMLYYGGDRRNIFFVELKDRSSNWINDAVEQLERTISIFNAKYPPASFGKKRAYAANRQHLSYHNSSSYRELSDTFRNKNHFGLCISGTIDIR